jgi:AcrR family transcriptional regulator
MSTLSARSRPIARPGRLSAENRRNQILDVTAEIADEKGFHAVSIEAVARRAGISRPIVYEHFGDLPGLLEALIDRMGERAIIQLAAVLPHDSGAGDLRERLLAALHGYLEAALADPVTWRLVLMPPEGAPPVARDRIAIGRNAVVQQLAEVVRPGLIGGRRTPDPELTARMLTSIADDAVRLVLTAPDEYPIERILDHARWLLDQMSPAAPKRRRQGKG